MLYHMSNSFKFECFDSESMKMPKSYSEDLRWRAVWLAVVRGLSVWEIASVLFMCEKSVHRYGTYLYSILLGLLYLSNTQLVVLAKF